MKPITHRNGLKFSVRTACLMALVIAGVVPEGASAAARPSGQPPKILYTANLSGDTDLPEACDALASESLPQIARVPGSSDELRAVYVQDGGEATIGASSSDGGRSWALSPVGGATGCTGGTEGTYTVNPFLAVARSGAAYYGNSWLGGPGGSQGVLLHRWDSPEAPWSPGVSPDGSDSAQNGNVAVDPSNSDTVAMMWSQLRTVATPAGRVPTAADLRFAVSSDGGRTFEPARTVIASAPGDLAVNSVLRWDQATGDLIAVYSVGNLAASAATTDPTRSQRTSLEVFAIRSSDGGETWSEPGHLGTQGFVWGHDPDDDALEVALLNGTVYASAKTDLALGPGGSVAVAWTDAAGGDRTAVELALSQDGGATWTRARSAEVDSEAIQPAVAFTDKGTLGVFFYDFRNDVTGDDDFTFDAWLQTSQDEGGTWKEIHLAGPFDLRESNSCSYPTPLPAFSRTNCELLFDGTELGVYQDLVGLSNGFGAAYTVAPPIAREGFTDVLYMRVLAP
ncbi:MAG: exo-alpha-sialidase [Actinobacteria bacterium]|nr:exo-alpha-sialidase [Actinomycetota bacterium]